MQREERDFHGKRDDERDEEPSPGCDAEVRLLGDLHEIEGQEPDVAARDERGGHDPDQHECRSGHRVEEELRCGIDALVISPVADEEVHRDEDDLEEDKEQEQVQAQEAAHHSGLQEQQPREIGLFVVVWIDSDDHEREQDAREHDEEERDAVDTEVPGDTPLCDPRVLGDELKTRLPRGELDQHPDAHRPGRNARHEGTQLDPFRPTTGQQRDHDRAEERNEDEHRQDREPHGCGRCGGDHARPRYTNQARSSTTPRATIAA